jgi:hypothetical protein
MHPPSVFLLSSVLLLSACSAPPAAETAGVEQIRSAHALTILDAQGQAQTLLLAGVTGPDRDAAPEAAQRARAALER